MGAGGVAGGNRQPGNLFWSFISGRRGFVCAPTTAFDMVVITIFVAFLSGQRQLEGVAERTEGAGDKEQAAR